MFQNFTETELIVLRDALKEYALSMRMRDGRVVKTEKEFLQTASPASVKQYLSALGMAKEAEIKIR